MKAATAPATSHAAAPATNAAAHRASSRAPSMTAMWSTAARFEHHLLHEHAQSKVADSKTAHEHAMQLHKRPVFDDDDHGGARYSGELVRTVVPVLSTT